MCFASDVRLSYTRDACVRARQDRVDATIESTDRANAAFWQSQSVDSVARLDRRWVRLCDLDGFESEARSDETRVRSSPKFEFAECYLDEKIQRYVYVSFYDDDARARVAHYRWWRRGRRRASIEL